MSEAIEENFSHIRRLARDIDGKFAGTTTSEQLLRNELAGMFAVTVAATYEGIVKQTLISYAANFHEKYRAHVENDFGRLNARISIDNLRSYSRHFGLQRWTGPDAPKKGKPTTFHRLLEEKRKIVERRFRTDMVKNYENLFTWRNDYAHERTTSVTFRDVYEAHRVAQYVIRSFVKAFEMG
ncbi:HEPN domain-containing protein [Qipengyuania flava]|uniref:HEPN domain-containing protein n=1 Tax=Qipengyuania flava TaxID=192812 RepID=UPI003BB01310